MEARERTFWAAEPKNQDPNRLYSQSSIFTKIIEMPADLEDKVISFFERYSVKIPESEDAYNCQRFGYWIADGPIAHELKRPGEPDPNIDRRIEIDGGMLLGQWGVLILGSGKKTVHSLIGLGEQTESFLQVMASQGYMGVDRLDRLKINFETHSALSLSSRS